MSPFSGARRWAWGFGRTARRSGLRAREVLAKLSGGRGEGRCASLQTGGSKPRAGAGREACARQRAGGGGPVGRSTRIRSERLQKQTSSKRKLERHQNLFLPWESFPP